MLGGDKKSTALVFIRLAVAVLLFIHGAARIANGTVDDFGSFLGSKGFPAGFFVAWAITLFELVGSVLLAAGFYAWIIALLFAAELAVGIGLVHWREGWFVVGAGRNGMEFSVLLIVMLVATAYVNYKGKAR
jgi:putative oxidoreductase